MSQQHSEREQSPIIFWPRWLIRGVPERPLAGCRYHIRLHTDDTQTPGKHLGMICRETSDGVFTHEIAVVLDDYPHWDQFGGVWECRSLDGYLTFVNRRYSSPLGHGPEDVLTNATSVTRPTTRPLKPRYIEGRPADASVGGHLDTARGRAIRVKTFKWMVLPGPGETWELRAPFVSRRVGTILCRQELWHVCLGTGEDELVVAAEPNVGDTIFWEFYKVEDWEKEPWEDSD